MRLILWRDYETLNTRVVSDPGATNSLSVPAEPEKFWVLRKLYISHDANGSTDFNNLVSKVRVRVEFNGVVKWDVFLHPGNGGTGSVEFENGPWEFDFDPGFYTGTKNEAMIFLMDAFGTGISSSINAIYN